MDAQPDTAKLKEFFFGYQCHGVVALIEYLSSPKARGLNSVGSSTIGLSKIMNEIWVDEDAQAAAAWFRTHSLHIGSRDGSVTPLQWLEEFSKLFDKLPVPARKLFDEICNDFALISQALTEGEVEIWREDGLYSIPPEMYELGKKYTAEELAPYRIAKSRVFSIDGDTETAPFDAPFESKTKH